MGANLTVYCLQELTDYAEFERLCHDLMVLVGYRSMEPLGGFSDKGRDAIHFSSTGGATIFAYSVREDWRAKLAEDANKIRKHNHTCDTIVFVTTSHVSAAERDEAAGSILDQYQWKLELYSLERLRTLLETQFQYVRANHPHIFPPAFLEIEARIKQTQERDHIFISYVPEDTALAEWLSRKLTAEGYLVWCDRFRSLGGDGYPSDVDAAIQQRVSRVVALYSEVSLRNPDIVRQRAIALGIGQAQIPNFLIPLRIENIPADQLDQKTRELVFVPFETNWSAGLQYLFNKLELLTCPKPLSNGKAIAAGAYLEQDVISNDPELVITNWLPVERIPDVILLFRPKRFVPRDELEQLKREWAFREAADGVLLSFQYPPQSLVTDLQLRSAGMKPWRATTQIQGINTKNLISELVRKSILAKCTRMGLQYCNSTAMYYFPFGLRNFRR